MRPFLLLILMCSLLVPCVTLAQQITAEAVAIQAKEQFKAGNFEAAAKLFMQAYAKSRTPALLYNVARAHEEAGKKGDALTLFCLYISLSEDVDGIMAARQRIQKLKAPEPLRMAVPLPQVIKPVPLVKPLPKVTRPESSRTAAWIMSGGALVTVGLGVGLMTDGAIGTQKYTRMSYSQYDSAKTEWLLGRGILGAGAALSGLSAYLWMHSPVTVAPMPKGVAFSVAF